MSDIILYTITEHISNIFVEGELIEKVVCRNIRLTTPAVKTIQTQL